MGNLGDAATGVLVALVVCGFVGLLYALFTVASS